VARKRQGKLKGEWRLQDDPIVNEELTAPERIMAMRLQLRYPSIFAKLRRSNAPYRGTGFRSDFTIEVEHYHYAGIVVEIQGGIYSRYRSGHSSSTGLKRDYAKVTVAQINGWFVLQVAPDEESLFAACDTLDDLIKRFESENRENDSLLAEIAG
jgi:hypothetical protein